MANIYELYGRLQELYAQECEEHNRTIGVLRALKSGETSLDKIVVTNDNKWAFIPAEAVAPDGQTDETPPN